MQFLLKIINLFISSGAVILQGRDEGLWRIGLFLEKCFHEIKLLNCLYLFFRSAQGVLGQLRKVREHLWHLIEMWNLDIFVILLKHSKKISPIIVDLFSDFNEVDHQLRLAF